jgi:hypothetical protein
LSADYGEDLDGTFDDVPILQVDLGLQGVDAGWILVQVPRREVYETWLVATS